MTESITDKIRDRFAFRGDPRPRRGSTVTGIRVLPTRLSAMRREVARGSRNSLTSHVRRTRFAGEMAGTTENAGTALVRLRWAKTTKAERQRVAAMLLEARRKKGRGKAESKRSRKAAAKS